MPYRCCFVTLLSINTYTFIIPREPQRCLTLAEVTAKVEAAVPLLSLRNQNKEVGCNQAAHILQMPFGEERIVTGNLPRCIAECNKFFNDLGNWMSCTAGINISCDDMTTTKRKKTFTIHYFFLKKGDFL